MSEANGQLVVDVRGVEKHFGDGPDRIHALCNVNLHAYAGEILMLVGPSGCGKTTLLSAIAGTLRVESGEIEVFGHSLHRMAGGALTRFRAGHIGFIFQQFNLIPSLTVGQNVTFQARLAGREDETRTRDLIRTLGLEPQVHKYPEELSGGQQQRVAIARAILPAPRLVLADEPTGNLDEATAETVFQTLLDLVGSSGAGLLLVTHSERLAARADRRLHLSHGRIQT